MHLKIFDDNALCIHSGMMHLFLSASVYSDVEAFLVLLR